jgi:hypothetical protein
MCHVLNTDSCLLRSAKPEPSTTVALGCDAWSALGPGPSGSALFGADHRAETTSPGRPPASLQAKLRRPSDADPGRSPPLEATRRSGCGPTPRRRSRRRSIPVQHQGPASLQNRRKGSRGGQPEASAGFAGDHAGLASTRGPRNIADRSDLVLHPLPDLQGGLDEAGDEVPILAVALELEWEHQVATGRPNGLGDRRPTRSQYSQNPQNSTPLLWLEWFRESCELFAPLHLRESTTSPGSRDPGRSRAR